MTLPKGWKPTSEKRGEEEKMMQISPYSPDRGSLPKGWVYSSVSNSDSDHNNVPQLKGKTKNKKTKTYSSSYRASPKPTSSGSVIGVVVVFVIIIWLIIGAISGAFGYWWYYLMFFPLLATALGSGRGWRSGYYISGMNG